MYCKIYVVIARLVSGSLRAEHVLVFFKPNLIRSLLLSSALGAVCTHSVLLVTAAGRIFYGFSSAHPRTKLKDKQENQDISGHVGHYFLRDNDEHGCFLFMWSRRFSLGAEPY